MELYACKRCKKLFQAMISRNICPECEKAEEDAFLRTKTYLRENKTAAVKEVCEACEVTMNQIKKWLREGRLEFGTGVSTGLTCDKCGKEIPSGKFCRECMDELHSAFGLTAQSYENNKKTTHSMGMRFIKN